MILANKKEGVFLHSTDTFKHSLKFYRNNGSFYMFLAPKRILDKEDYEGCSGAPLLDSEGKIVALASAVLTNSKIIYGFPIQECKELLDYAIQIIML